MRTEIRKLSDKVLGKLISVHGDGDLHDHMTLDTWEWPQGVALYAMMKLYQDSGDPELLDSIKLWYDRRLNVGLPARNINTTAPMLGMTYLYQETKEEKYLKSIGEWAEWIIKKLPRTKEGGFQHVTSDDVNEQQIWDDTLFMTVLFLDRAGIILDRKEYRQEAEYQYLLHIQYLKDQKTNLWYHGYCFDGGHHFANAFWCRGNSWFTSGSIDYLESLEESSVRRLIKNAYIAQCEALRSCQDPQSGLWHTLLDDPSSYLETSGSAAIAYGLLKGIRLGILPSERFTACALKARDGVIGMIGEDGTVKGVSYGTPMGRELDFYRNIPIRPTAYGQGLVFLMLTEDFIN